MAHTAPGNGQGCLSTLQSPRIIDLKVGPISIPPVAVTKILIDLRPGDPAEIGNQNVSQQ